MLVAGDYNLTPEELVAMGCKLIQGRYIVGANVEQTVTGEGGRYIDYAIASGAMNHIIQKIVPRYDVPCRPHIGTEYILARKPRSIYIRSKWQPRIGGSP